MKLNSYKIFRKIRSSIGLPTLLGLALTIGFGIGSFCLLVAGTNNGSPAPSLGESSSVSLASNGHANLPGWELDLDQYSGRYMLVKAGNSKCGTTLDTFQIRFLGSGANLTYGIDSEDQGPLFSFTSINSAVPETQGPSPLDPQKLALVATTVYQNGVLTHDETMSKLGLAISYEQTILHFTPGHLVLDFVHQQKNGSTSVAPDYSYECEWIGKSGN